MSTCPRFLRQVTRRPRTFRDPWQRRPPQAPSRPRSMAWSRRPMPWSPRPGTARPGVATPGLAQARPARPSWAPPRRVLQVQPGRPRRWRQTRRPPKRPWLPWPPDPRSRSSHPRVRLRRQPVQTLSRPTRVRRCFSWGASSWVPSSSPWRSSSSSSDPSTPGRTSCLPCHPARSSPRSPARAPRRRPWWTRRTSRVSASRTPSSQPMTTALSFA